MANQALIQAAQRMYSAKAKVTNIDPLLKSVSGGIVKVQEAISAKRKDQKSRAGKTTETFKDILLENPKIRPELTAKLVELQDQYSENLKISEGLFRSKKEGSKAANAVEANNLISAQLQKYEKQLRAVDLNKVGPDNISKANNMQTQADDVLFRDKTLADNLIIKDDGLYFLNSNSEEIPLDEYKQPKQIYTEGIDGMGNVFGVIQTAGENGLPYEGKVRVKAESEINKYLDADNFDSLLFDDIGPFNWAKENMKQYFGEDAGNEDGEEGDKAKYLENLEKLKEMVAKNPQEFKDEFKRDYLAAAKIAYNDAKGQREVKSSSRERSFTKDRENDFNRFIETYEAAKSQDADLIVMPDGGYAKYIGKGKYQLLTKNQSPIEGADGTVSDQDLISMAGLPDEFARKLEKRYSGPLAADEFNRETKESNASETAKNLIDKYKITG